MVILLAFLASFFHKTGSCRHTLIYASYTGLFTVLVEPYSTRVAKTTIFLFFFIFVLEHSHYLQYYDYYKYIYLIRRFVV